MLNFSRPILGQTGSGHFSPIAAWHPASDMALVLDTARFKYPAFWAPIGKVLEACVRGARAPALQRVHWHAHAGPRLWFVWRRVSLSAPAC